MTTTADVSTADPALCQSGASARVVIAAPEGETLDPATLADISADLADLPEVVGASDPTQTGTVSPDGTIAFSTVQYEGDSLEVTEVAYEALVEEATAIEADGMQVELGGEVVASNEQAEPASSELIGLIVAVFVLLFAFGSVIAMGLPLITALIWLGIGLMGITLMSAVTDLSSTAPILAAAATVFVAVCVAVSLLPALLGFAGHNIDRFTLPGMKAKASSTGEVTFGTRWAGLATRHPLKALVGGLAVMGLLAIPVFSLRLGFPDAGTQPESSTQRQSYDLLAEGFGPGFNGPLTVVVDLTATTDRPAALEQVSAAIGADEGVATVAPPATNPDGDTAILNVIPTTGPAEAATSDLVERLRAEDLPEVEAATGAAVSVTGSTASNIDISDKMLSALPVFILLVIGLTLLLLMVVFRSIVVPIRDRRRLPRRQRGADDHRSRRAHPLR